MEVFFYVGLVRHSVSDSEADCFYDRLVTAEHDFVCKTLKAPTHLILGATEWIQFQGWIGVMRHREKFSEALKSQKTPMTFRGMEILRSNLESLLCAAINE